MESVAERVADYLVGHHPGVPRRGQAEQALAAACGLVHALHATRMPRPARGATGSRPPSAAPPHTHRRSPRKMTPPSPEDDHQATQAGGPHMSVTPTDTASRKAPAELPITT